MLHFIVATPNMQVERYPGDCLGPFYHEFSLAKNPLVIEGPFTTLNAGPASALNSTLSVSMPTEFANRRPPFS